MAGFSSRGEQFDTAPFVLAVDRSGSMDGVIGTVNSWIPELITTLRDVPEARESVALGIVSFNTAASVDREIVWLDDDPLRPGYSAHSRTSYVAPLQATRELIAGGVPKLGKRGWRPVVFFITDGHPNVDDERDWMAARERLLARDFHLRPKLVPLGFGQVSEDTLRKLASSPELAELGGGNPRVALDEILEVIQDTIVTITSGDGSGPADPPPGAEPTLAQRILASERRTVSYAA